MIIFVILHPIITNFKKMRKILLFINMMIVGISAHAQGITLQNQEEEDSTIAVIGYFCKDDSMTFRRVQGKEKIIGNDTTIMNEITEEFMVVVTDSTSAGYKMELIPLSCKVEGQTNDQQTLMASLLWNDIKDLRCRFTTDEYGTVQHIENWREIRDVLKKSYATVLDSVYAVTPALDSVMPLNQFKNLLLLGCSSEDGIKEQYDELEQLFGYHGLEFTMEPVESDDVSDMGYPTHSKIESFYSTKKDEYDFDGDFVIRNNTVTTLSAEDTKDLLTTTFSVLFTGEVRDSVNKYTENAMKEGMTVTNIKQSCYFYNGWPKLLQSLTEINIGNMAKRIEYDTIEWTTRRWGVYHFPEEEEKGKDL